MRCECCDVVLTPQESVRKFKESGMYTNTCSKCLREIGVPTIEGRHYEEDEEIIEPFDEDDVITDEVEDWE